MEVPDVVGMKEADAAAKLVGLGLEYSPKHEVKLRLEVGTGAPAEPERRSRTWTRAPR